MQKVHEPRLRFYPGLSLVLTMGNFYQLPDNERKPIWLYSERGLLSYLLHHVVLKDPSPVLSRAKNTDGKSLEETIGFHIDTHLVLTEFDLGSEGFGSPDGGFLLRGDATSAFVFIEGKAVPFDVSFQDPAVVAGQVERLERGDWEGVDIDSLVSQNTFNSSINGQLELKWRFINAVRAAARAGDFVVSERRCTVPKEILRVDRFYWRRQINPNPDIPDHWRRVDMSGDLRCLYDLLTSADRFFLLAITADKEFPQKLSKVRLFNENGTAIELRNATFWMSMSAIEKQLKRL